MTQENLLTRLRDLCLVDQAILRIVGERSRLQTEFEKLSKLINTLKKEVQQLQTQSSEDKKRYDRDTNQVRIEKEALVSRRRNLQTLGNYKLQQAAGKEVDAAEKALSEHEDSLLALLDSSEKSKKVAEDKELLLLEKEEEMAALSADLRPTLETLAAREAKAKAEREEIVAKIDPKNMSVYMGVFSKLAPDPLAGISENCCEFCNSQVPPQMLILINQGASIQKCRGCNRILYLKAVPQVQA
jgi:predicted  nucleic acid-binding Zn-ribbon protein